MSDWLALLESPLPDSVLSALREEEKQGADTITIALSKGLVEAEDILEALSRQYNLPALALDGYEPSPEAVSLLPEERARSLEMLPLFVIKDQLYVACVNPHDLEAQDYLVHTSGCSVEPILVLKPQLESALNRCYLTERQSADFIDTLTARSLIGHESEAAIEAQEAISTDSPAVRLLNHILTQGVRLGASDIHIEPYEGRFELRYRVDGVLHNFPPPPWHLGAALVSIIKISSDMDIAEKRLPQDGRSSVTVDGINYDLRVSIMPNVNGEGVVMRIMDPVAMNKVLEDLGFPEALLAQYDRCVGRPWGIILVTGPTGSGKSTTLYATLKRLLSPEKKVITLEDPVEFKMDGITQIPIIPSIGYTFVQGLRSVLRHDPDIIMVGEIRDKDSAEIAIKAALTGHLLLSTIHTNNATQTVSRLLDMGLKPYQVQAALCGILAQRLARRLCQSCKKPVEPTCEQLTAIGLEKIPESVTVFGPNGCQECNGLGYRGRVGIYEFLEFTPAMKKLSQAELTPDKLVELGRDVGFTTLRECVVEKFLEGTTSIQEVIRLTSED